MLNRRQLRLKVVQAIYAYEQSGNDRMDVGEKELFKSLNDIDRLFINQLSLLCEVVDLAAVRLEEGKNKFLPSAEEKNPSTRFIDNRVFTHISENLAFQKRKKAYKINWGNEKDLIRKLFNNIKESENYNKFLYSEKNSFASDRTFIEKMYMEFFVENEDIETYYEEISIHWASDYDIVNNLVLRYLKNMKENQPVTASIPELFPIDSVEGISEDRTFVKDLFRKTIINKEAHTKLVAERAKNWEFDRIATMDRLLLRMAVTEILLFSSIPLKVTLNEYIELSKIFSTPKSRIFINGVLDKLIEQLKAEKKIIKTGRGLMEN